jgi:AcrR family transcriptional regulator
LFLYLPNQWIKMAKTEPTTNLSTEEKFKEAARIVFTKKGYAATKTRDIAEQAGLNLALLNYYFRSKEKLFEIIMLEKIQQLFSFIAPTLNDETTSLDEKIDRIAEKYIDMLIEHPDLPLFVLSEIRTNPVRFAENVQMQSLIMRSRFIKQIAEKKPDINPFHFVTSFLGMLVFPFVSKPVFQSAGLFTDEIFNKLMEERKTLTAKWLKIMLE